MIDWLTVFVFGFFIVSFLSLLSKMPFCFEQLIRIHNEKQKTQIKKIVKEELSKLKGGKINEKYNN